MLTELTAVTDQLNAERDRGVTEKNAQRAKMTELEGSKEELKANEQRLKQQANTIRQKAAMTQVKIVMKGVMKGEQCAMLHQWSARAMDAKQAERDERDAAELEAFTDRAETEQARAATEKQTLSIEMTASKEAARAKVEALDGVITAMMAQHAESLVLEQQRVAELQEEVAGLRELHALETKQLRSHFIGKIEELTNKLPGIVARQSPSR